MKILVSGLMNIETTLKIEQFPLNYYPVDYPFFGIKSDVSGVAYNVAKALLSLENQIQLTSFIGSDEEGKRIRSRLDGENIGNQYIYEKLSETPVTVALYDNEGKRQIHCDLKDIQEKTIDFSKIESAVMDSDLVVLCNINFNRSLLKQVKEAGKLIASDVHVISDINDEYNQDFMKYADILFFSDEQLPCEPSEFLRKMKDTYSAEIMVIGLGKEGALMYERAQDKMYRLGAALVGDVVNTIGAGDALFSSFINYYLKGYPAVEALKRAEIFAALKIRHNGAAVGFSSEEVVEEHYQKCSIQVQEL
jgi:sugar/nucleoside kinase (ribokinase family)